MVVGKYYMKIRNFVLIGRRGGRQSNGSARPTPQPQVQSWEVNQRMVQRERYQVPAVSRTSQQNLPGYRTQLGKQAMI